MRPVCLALYLVLAVALEFQLDLELSFFEHAFLLRFSHKRRGLTSRWTRTPATKAR
uniref:Uncharacterized protein n=1 Tax=Setaria viridis TaxID=4556 RepID=A0A4U6W8V6_SETVI|nr:hypothetical protein SEVIR_1G145592v2 [Setaria viridis]